MRRANNAPATLRIGFLLWLFAGLLVFPGRALPSDETTPSPKPAPAREAELREKWDQLDPKKREALLDRYSRWKRLSPEKKQTVQENLKRFRSLPKAEKNRILNNYRTFQQLPYREKRNILNNYQRWKKMGPVEKQRMRERYRQNVQQPAGPQGRPRRAPGNR